jgi:hypothetical protein
MKRLWIAAQCILGALGMLQAQALANCYYDSCSTWPTNCQTGCAPQFSVWTFAPCCCTYWAGSAKKCCQMQCTYYACTTNLGETCPMNSITRNLTGGPTNQHCSNNYCTGHTQ